MKQYQITSDEMWKKPAVLSKQAQSIVSDLSIHSAINDFSLRLCIYHWSWCLFVADVSALFQTPTRSQ